MAEENAREEAAKEARGAEMTAALEGLKMDLGLAALPRRIEGFDIAHLEGTDTVASIVRFTDGRPDRKLYRAFNIRSLDGKIDDFESIREAVARRYTRVLNEELEKPDLILIDGGKGQLERRPRSPCFTGTGGGARHRPCQEEGGDLPARPGRPLLLDEASPSLRILEAVRNESHRFATTLNRKKRAKRVALTLLEGVPGIGQAQEQAADAGLRLPGGNPGGHGGRRAEESRPP